MQTAGGGFAAAVTNQDQIVDYKVTVTLPGGVQSSYSDVTKSVVSIDIQRSITSNLPDGTSLISGYPSASASVVLSGFLNQAAGVALVEAQSIYWLMNPNDPTSPMYRTTRTGLPITIQAGLWDGASAADLVTIFTGTIDSVACSEGTVTLTCRDLRASITNQAMLPPVITAAPYNSGLTASFAMDYSLRHSSPAKFYSWPPQHSNCLLAVGFESSIWPEVGSLYAGYVQDPVFVPGPYGYGLGAVPSVIVFTPTSPLLTTDTNTCHFLCGGDAVICVNDNPAVYQIIISRVGTTLFFYTNSPGGQSVASWTIAAGNHEIEYSATWPASSTSVTGTVWIDGTAHSVSLTAKDARPTGRSFTLASAGGGSPGGLRGLQITNETSYATHYPFTPTFILDSNGSLDQLTAMPDVSGQDVWSVLQDIAAAENGVIGFDELGICRFTNRQTIANNVTPVRTVTSTASLASLDSLEQMSLCATHIQVPVSQLLIGGFAIVWQASTILVVQPGIPLVITAALSNPAVNVPTQDSGFLPDTTSWSYANAYWMGSTTLDGLGTPVTSGVSFTVTQTSAQVLTIVVTNSTSAGVALVAPFGHPTPAGTPTLIIGGQPILSQTNAITNNSIAVAGTASGATADYQWPPQIPSTVAGVAPSGGAITNTTFGDITLALPANGWVQSLASANSLAADLLSDLHYPIPLLRNVSIVADPRLQMLDPVTIVDTDVSMINDLSILVGIETSLSAGEWTQSIDARPLWPPGAWVLGLAGQSELGTTTYLY